MRQIFAVLGLAAATALASFGPATAQEVPQITVRPLDERAGGGAYVGPYGRELPGVRMFSGRPVSLAPEYTVGLPPFVDPERVPQAYTYQDPLPVLDAWHGTLGPAFPLRF